MAEGTIQAKIDDFIKGFTEFRKETEVQIHEPNDKISRFMHAGDQRITKVSACSQHSSEESPMNLPVVSNNNHSNHQFCSMKIEVPHFDGFDVSSWMFKLEQFFQFNNTPEDQRVLIFSFHLEGPALSWFKWMHSNGFIESWEEFVKAINLRFGPSLYEDYKGALSKLQQTTTVASYQDQIEDLSTKVQDTTILEEVNEVEESVVAGSCGIPEGHKFGMDLFILPIQGADVVLGIQWLKLLGSVITNYKLLTMNCQWNGKEVHFKLTKSQNIASLFQLKALGNVKPYRHPHFQKSEMEDAELVNKESLAQRLSFKLSQMYFGPFLVTKNIGQVAYELELPHTIQIHLLFHTSQLKPFIGSIVPTQIVNLTSTSDDIHMNLEDQVRFNGEWNDTNITSAAAAVVGEGTEITEKGTEEKKEIVRSIRLRRKPAWVEDCIL